jgi:hypothetical protein
MKNIPPYSNQTTSKAAAAAMKPNVKQVRAIVEKVWKDAGPDGLADPQAIDILRGSHYDIEGGTVRARRNELIEDPKGPKIMDSGRKWHNPKSNRNVIVWVHTDYVDPAIVADFARRIAAEQKNKSRRASATQMRQKLQKIHRTAQAALSKPNKNGFLQIILDETQDFA